MSLQEVQDIAEGLLARGAACVFITLGPNGAFGATASAEVLRERFQKQASPSASSSGSSADSCSFPYGDLATIANQRVRCDAFEPLGAINSVGAGDTFFAGIMGALWYYFGAHPAMDGNQAAGSGGSASKEGPGAEGGDGVVRQALQQRGDERAAGVTLEHILKVGMASALWRVDTGRGDCPPLPELIDQLPSLTTLAPPNSALSAM